MKVIIAVLALAAPAACALLSGGAGMRVARVSSPCRAVTHLAEAGSDDATAVGTDDGPHASPAMEEEVEGIEKAFSWLSSDGREPPPPAFTNVLTEAEEAVLVKAMRAAKMVWFGVPYATKKSDWDGARAAEPLLAGRSNEELYAAYMSKPRRF